MSSKMGMRVSRNLQNSAHTVFYSENSRAGQERLRAEGRDITSTEDAVKNADVVILAVPDTALGIVSKGVLPQLKAGAKLLTVDPAAAYAGLLAKRDEVVQAVAHPCHPSVTVKQLAILEPTMVETVACMIGTLLNEALHETVHTAGVPEEAAKAMLFGHVQITLTNALRGSNPISEACEIAIQYGKDTIIKDDWKKIFDDSELDGINAKMLKLDAVKRQFPT